MLYVLLDLNENRFAIEASQVVELLPLVELAKVPCTSSEVAGYFNHRGTLVPVIDLCQLLMGRPAMKRFSTRIILIQFTDSEGTNRFAGLIAEQATATIRKNPDDFVSPGIATEQAPYLGPVTMEGDRFVQLVNPEILLRERANEWLAFLPAGG